MGRCSGIERLLVSAAGGVTVSMFLAVLLISACRQNPPAPDCDIQAGACTRTIGRTEVVLDVSSRPVRVMDPVEFIVRLRNAGSAPARIMLELSMPGMEMGENRVVLRRTGDGTYRGSGIMVKCTSGSRLWKATLWVPGTGEAEYIFRTEDE